MFRSKVYQLTKNNGVNKRKANILIVEDNELDMLVLKVLLERHFNLYIVTNGQDAIKAAAEFDFDVVLADINLGDPKMDGVKTMKEIRSNKNYSHIPTIILTTSTFAQDESSSYKLGASCFLHKPQTYAELLEISYSIARLWLKQIPGK